MAEVLTTAEMQTMGILDLFNFWRSGKLAEFRELLNAFKTRDVKQIADEIGDVAEMFGMKGMDLQINQFAAELVKGADNWAAIGSEFADVQKIFFEKFRKQPLITTMAAPPHVSEMLRADAVAWMRDNRSNIRKGAGLRLVKWRLKEAPEVIAALNGDAITTAMDPERLARIIDICRGVAKFCSFMAALPTPYSIYFMAVAQVLNLIIARYDSVHPNATGADIGLELSDLA